MENMLNSGVGCEVEECRHNVRGTSCNLAHIHVGCGCDKEKTCCDSFEEKN